MLVSNVSVLILAFVQVEPVGFCVEEFVALNAGPPLVPPASFAGVIAPSATVAVVTVPVGSPPGVSPVIVPVAGVIIIGISVHPTITIAELSTMVNEPVSLIVTGPASIALFPATVLTAVEMVLPLLVIISPEIIPPEALLLSIVTCGI